jgi:hypothetical protein
MKKCFVIWGLLLLAVTAKADPEFLKNLPAEDFTAAGLQKLSPEERARLEALVQRFKAGVVAEERQQAEAKAASTREEAEKKIAAAEMEAKAAEARASQAALKAKEAETRAAVAPGKKQPGWFAALITLDRASASPEKEQPLVSRLEGDFDGWNGKSVFTLENGTRWVQQNRSESYAYSPVLHSPKVKISPAMMGGFWLKIEGVNLSVRVVPLDLTKTK